MGNQIETQKERSQGTSIEENSMDYLLKKGLRTKCFRIIWSKINSITFYRSLEMSNEIVTQKERSQGTSNQQNFVHYLPKGGVREEKISKCFCSKSNQINFYKSLGMRNQLETQKERSERTSIQQNSMHYLPRGRSENKSFQNYLL